MNKKKTSMQVGTQASEQEKEKKEKKNKQRK